MLQFTGIPVSVGIASTKCLTKVANEIVKKDARYEGVLDFTALSEQATRDTLFFAVQGITRPWKMRQSRLSGHFTTHWSDILTIN